MIVAAFALMLQCFVRGCKQTQVAARTKLQDHDLNLESVQSSTFLPFFASSYHRRHFFKGQTVQKPGERRQWFPLNRFCVQKLIKNKLARKPDDTKHRVVKKMQGVPLNLNKAVPVKKASKDGGVDMIAHHVLSSDGLIIQLARYLVT